MHIVHSTSNWLQPLWKYVYFLPRSSVNLHLHLRYFWQKNNEIIVRIPCTAQHPEWGYKKSVECLNATVLKDKVRWLPSTHTQPVSKLRLVTAVT
jgi:hypothetical protein